VEAVVSAVDLILDEALADLGRGFALLPVNADKTPATRLIRATRGSARTRQLADRPALEDEVRAWLELGATGIGVLTGAPSGIVVYDIDDPSLAPRLPASATVVTARGWHVYSRRTRPVRTRAFPWGEIRGERSYVVAPYSPHRSGPPYAWASTPEETPLVDFDWCENATADFPTQIRSTGRRESRSPSFNRPTCSALADLDRDERTALRLAVALGAPNDVRLGEPFACVLHAERSPSACLWRRSDDAHVLYHDWHTADGATWLPLALVRARLAGRQGPIAAPELLVWKLRLANEAGLVEPMRFDADQITVPADLEHAWYAFLHLLGLRWTVTPGAPAPFSARFAGAWIGTSTRQSHEAITRLAQLGLLHEVGRDIRGTRLWLPPEEVMPPTDA
jgi:hypothetical protein